MWLDIQPNSMFGTDDKFAEVFDSTLEAEIGSDSLYTPAQMKQRSGVLLFTLFLLVFTPNLKFARHHPPLRVL